MSPAPAGPEAPEDAMNLQELIEATFNAMDALGPADSPSGNENNGRIDLQKGVLVLHTCSPHNQ